MGPRQAKISGFSAGLPEVNRRPGCNVEANREGVVGSDSTGRLAVVLRHGVDSLAVLQAPMACAQARLSWEALYPHRLIPPTESARPPVGNTYGLG